MPVHGLFELRLMVSALNGKLSDIHCPTYLYQGDQDPVVEPVSAEIIMEKISSETKSNTVIPSTRHGILNEDIGHIQQLILDQLARLESTIAVH